MRFEEEEDKRIFDESIKNKGKNVNKIITKTKNLTDNEKRHILNILLTYKVEFTKNYNGYFFYLYKINDEIINKILKCIDLIEEKRDLISNLDKKRDDHLEYYKSVIETKLNETIIFKKKLLTDNLRVIEDNFYIIKKKNNKTKKVEFYEDIDILIKEYSKKKKHRKNSIYHKISQVMIQNVRKNNKHSKKIKNECGGAGNEGDGEDNNIQESNIEEIDNNDNDDNNDNFDKDNDDDDKDDNDNDNDNDIISNDSDNDSDSDSDSSKGSELDNEYYNSDNDSLNEFEVEKTDTNTNTQTKKCKSKNKKIKITSNEFYYYKNLLRKNGVKFDDDKEVIMINEEYII